MALEDADVIAVGHEADLHGLGLVRRGEAEPPGERAGLRLGQRAHGRQHPLHDRAVDAPQEVALVLLRIVTPVESPVARDRVMPGGDVATVERVRVCEQVAELGEGVAPDARNGGTAVTVLAHEVLDDVQVEAILEIEDVVRDAEHVGHVARVVDRIERAAGAVGNVFAVAEQLHRGAHHVVALLDEACSGHGAVYSAGHRHQHALTHVRALPRASAPSPRRWASPRPRDPHRLRSSRGPG